MQTYLILRSQLDQTYIIRRTFYLSVIFFIAFGPIFSFGQDTTRARKRLQILTSSKFKGRGYLQNGVNKAAEFIRGQFQKSNLIQVSGSYYQNLIISQNLFPKDLFFAVNGKKLELGIDFLPSPGCGPIKGKYKLQYADSAFISKNKARLVKDEAWIISPYLANHKAFKKQYNPDIWINLKPKLTHSLAETQSETPEFVLKQSAFKETDTLIDLKIEAEVNSSIQTKNVIGMVKGNVVPDSFLVVCAHYDHLGMIGKKVIFPGANDNASGTVMMLELVEAISKKPLRYSVLFIAFTGEEAGLLGSQYFVEHPLVPLSKIKFLMNLDLLGFGESGATIVNGSVHQKEFERLVQINTSNKFLPEIKARGKASNSDHFPFSEKGVPAFFLYTMGGPGFYHDVHDKAESVTFSRFKETYSLLMEFLTSF